MKEINRPKNLGKSPGQKDVLFLPIHMENFAISYSTTKMVMTTDIKSPHFELVVLFP